MSKRLIIRTLLIVALIISCVVVVYVLNKMQNGCEAVWSALAGALAVITAVISAWAAQRVLELQEDSLLPEPYPSLDFKSRYGLVQLRVTNNGGTTAYNINLAWRNHIVDHEGKNVVFPHKEGSPEIPVLSPKESVSIPIGGSHQFMNQGADLNYSDTIKFENAKAEKCEREFFLSAEMYRTSLVYDEEEVKTHYELQKIPQEIEKLRKEIGSIGQRLAKRDE